MIAEAQKFWTETPLNAVQLLIDQTFSYAQESIDTGLYDCYMDDLKYFNKAVELFRQSDGEGIAELCDDMDTAPLEQLVVALAKDCGADFVKSYLGKEVS